MAAHAIEIHAYRRQQEHHNLHLDMLYQLYNITDILQKSSSNSCLEVVHRSHYSPCISTFSTLISITSLTPPHHTSACIVSSTLSHSQPVSQQLRLTHVHRSLLAIVSTATVSGWTALVSWGSRACQRWAWARTRS